MPTQRANGIDIYYEMAGQGEPLLLLHGLGSRSDDWQLQMPAFAARYCVVAADMRGHGRSAKPPGPYSVPLMAAMPLAVATAASPPSSAASFASSDAVVGVPQRP